MSYLYCTYLLYAIKQGMQRMVIKQIRNAIQQELTYIPVRTSAQTGSRQFTWTFSS